MAKCDEGYMCSVCGKEVPIITESTLYLRYIIGDLGSDVLMSAPEQHIICDASIAQYIVDENFEPIVCDGPADKREFPADHVSEREELVTRGWLRLLEVKHLGIPISEYPLSKIEDSD